jgi:hypothetical protein
VSFVLQKAKLLLANVIYETFLASRCSSTLAFDGLAGNGNNPRLSRLHTRAA